MQTTRRTGIYFSKLELGFPSQLGKTVAGKYIFLKLIGTGGFYDVYLAKDKNTGKEWAIKVFNKKNRDAGFYSHDILTDEQIMFGLNHPSIPMIADIIENDEYLFIVREYIQGEYLSAIVAKYGAQPAERVIEWGKQLCDALGYLHSQSLIYRDMKPYNVVLKTDGTLKVVDFGIMRKYNPNQAADPCCLGTKGYASPEQYSGQSDFRSDIFGLGMTMFYLVTGIEPRKTAYDANLIYAVNPNFPKGFEYIISKCTMLAAEDRYQNCSELMSDLNNYQKLPKRKGLIERLFAKKG